MSAVSIKLEVGLTPVNCGHTCVQAGWMPVYSGHTSVQPGWTGVRPPWTPGCPSWFLFSILYQKELIFLKDISQHDWSIYSLIFGDFIFLKFLNIFPELGHTPVHGGHTPVQGGHTPVLWTTGCPCQGYQYCYITHKPEFCLSLYNKLQSRFSNWSDNYKSKGGLK